MRATSDDLAKVIEGGAFVARLELDVHYGAERTLENVGTADGWQLRWSRSADVPGSGTVLAHYSSKRGETMTPKAFSDRLAPFGQQAVPKMIFTVGDREEVVQVGRWEIDDVPRARDDQMRVLDRLVSVNSYVELVLNDSLGRVRARGFSSVESPPAGARAWAELQRLTGMKILQRGANPLVPPSMKYELADGGRLRAVRTLAEAIGGTPYVTSDDTLTVLPHALGEPVRTFVAGRSGTIFDIPYAMSREGVANEIVGIFEDADRNPINVAPVRQTTGPLSVSGPLGVRTRYVDSSDYPDVQTAAQAKAVMEAVLARSTQQQTVRVAVEAALDPRIEVGDVVALERTDSTDVGSVEDVTFRSNWTMQMLVDVVRSTPEDNTGD